MDDIGVVMTPFGDVVTVILVVNSYVFGFLCEYHIFKIPNTRSRPCRLILQSS